MSDKDTIYRQAAIDAFRKELCVEETESCREYAIGFFGIERVLNDLPSAQPKIIRCKDCKYASGDDYCHCKYVAWYNNPDDFCSRAEKK